MSTIHLLKGPCTSIVFHLNLESLQAIEDTSMIVAPPYTLTVTAIGETRWFTLFHVQMCLKVTPLSYKKLQIHMHQRWHSMITFLHISNLGYKNSLCITAITSQYPLCGSFPTFTHTVNLRLTYQIPPWSYRPYTNFVATMAFHWSLVMICLCIDAVSFEANSLHVTSMIIPRLPTNTLPWCFFN